MSHATVLCSDCRLPSCRTAGKLTLVALALILAAPQAALTEDHRSKSPYKELPKRERPTWRFEFANDVLFDSDNQFTNGFTVQKHSTVGGSVDDLRGAVPMGKGLARRILPSREDLFYRKALRIGQNMVTPNEIEDPNIILDDLPYMGLLAGESSWIAFNDNDLTGFAVTVGVVGKASLAEQVQTGVHSLIDSADPQGWDHQLDDEPVIGFHFLKKKKLWNRPYFDGGLTAHGAVGNWLTGGDLGFEIRFGRKPGGFAYIQDAVGRGMAYDAVLPRQDDRADIYFSLQARAFAWAVFMPLEGNTFASGNEWTDNNTIDPENVVGQLLGGFHIVNKSWGLHFTWLLSTDNVDKDSLMPGIDPEGNFGTIMAEWRF